MNVEKSKELKIYLTSWQKRMVEDFTSKKELEPIGLERMKAIKIKWKPGGCLASYKLPPDGIRENDWVLYLTSEQMMMVAEEFGLKEHISAVNISKEALKSGEISFI